MATDVKVSKNHAWLEEYLAKGGVATDNTTGETVDKENLSTFLEEVGEGKDKGVQAQTKRVHNKAVRAGVVTDPEEETTEGEETPEDTRNNRRPDRRIKETASNVADSLGENIGPAIDRVGSLQTVGGIGLLLGVLLLLLFVVVQVNSAGDTRLKQFWYMLSGNAQLEGRVTPTGLDGSIPGVNGSSGNFGGGAGASFGTTSAVVPGNVTPITPSVSSAFSARGSTFL